MFFYTSKTKGTKSEVAAIIKLLTKETIRSRKCLLFMQNCNQPH